MTHALIAIIAATVLLSGAAPGWGQQSFLYTPKPIGSEEKVQKKDGVLVQEVTVKKGDTLFGISRAFSGHGTYYPQILLFNDIKNPDRIYPGNVLKIPVTRGLAPDQTVKTPVQEKVSAVPSAGPAAQVPAVELKKAEGEKGREPRIKAAAPEGKRGRTVKQATAGSAANSEQRLFERAIKAYRQDDYRSALELFDRFLVEFPASALAADASLYKAECYLKQSNQ
ncbi:MAG: LysM peptidoglycan-binding domain-containing protein [Geobacteraceae bacterium]|nr:LysM peptidoglycan-binding domain-containing protein [Geobacteraceae bacterium]